MHSQPTNDAGTVVHLGAAYMYVMCGSVSQRGLAVCCEAFLPPLALRCCAPPAMAAIRTASWPAPPPTVQRT